MTVLLLLLIVISPVGNAASLPPLFTTVQQARQHCPTDVVVWLNISSGVYHFRGQRWYGATKNGAFVCKREADQAGTERRGMDNEDDRLYHGCPNMI